MNWGKNTRQRNSKYKGPEEEDQSRMTLRFWPEQRKDAIAIYRDKKTWKE